MAISEPSSNTVLKPKRSVIIGVVMGVVMAPEAILENLEPMYMQQQHCKLMYRHDCKTCDKAGQSVTGSVAHFRKSRPEKVEVCDPDT